LGIYNYIHSNFTFTFPKFRALRHLGKDGMGQSCKTLRQRTLKQIIHLPRGLRSTPKRNASPSQLMRGQRRKSAKAPWKPVRSFHVNASLNN